MTENKYGAPEGRFHVRDEWDGSWFASDDIVEAEQYRIEFDGLKGHSLRVDDMED